MGRKRTRNVWMWDIDVAECFDLWDGKTIARYFEALRYRQQLTPGKPFTYKADDIRKNSGLPYKKQQKARFVLEGSGWIEVERTAAMKFQLTPLALEAIEKIPHNRNIHSVKSRLTNRLSVAH